MEQPEKERKVKFDDPPQDSGGPPPDEATEATPLLDSPVVPGEEASKNTPTDAGKEGGYRDVRLQTYVEQLCNSSSSGTLKVCKRMQRFSHASPAQF